MAPARLLVMISGGGRTLVNLAEVIRAGELPAEIVHVISSAPSAGVERARALGISVEVMPGVLPEEVLDAKVREHKVDWIVLAGYLKFVHIPPRLEGRGVNIHPSLLPRHGGAGMYGHHVHDAVLRAGDRRSGCTVHMVSDAFDRGSIVLQRTCAVLPTDTAETLAARVFEQECLAYPEALRILLNA